MSINRNWNGSGHVFSFPTLYRQEAQHRVSYLAKYLAMEYSPRIYAHFTTVAVAIAESMEWDATLKKPISANESLCRDIENITFSWEIPAQSSRFTPTPSPPATLDNLTVPYWDNPAPAQPPLPPAVPTLISAPNANDSPPAVTTSSARLRIKQLQAQVLAMSGVPPPADSTLVDTPIPIRRPPSTPAPHSLANFDSLAALSRNNTAPAQPLPPQAVPTPVSTPLATDSPPVVTTGSTRLLVQQLQAQVLAMSGIPPPAVNTLVGPSMSTKDLLRHLQWQVTSLSAAGIQQPMAAGTPQTPAMVSSPLGSVPTDPGSGA